jgi:hypothetical protein
MDTASRSEKGKGKFSYLVPSTKGMASQGLRANWAKLAKMEELTVTKCYTLAHFWPDLL